MIFFDLDNTLLDDDAARRNYLPVFFQRYRHLSAYDFSTFSKKWVDSLEHYYRLFLDGKLTHEEQRLRRIEFSFGVSGLSRHELEEIGNVYVGLLESNWILFPEWRPFLDNSSSPKAVVTNGSSQQQRKKLKTLGLEQYFGHVFISEEVGYSKPSRELFKLLLKETKHGPQECVFVGDSLENDIVPALDAGMKAVWINHYGKTSGIRDANLVEVSNVGDAVKELEKFELRRASSPPRIS
jgi:putative hydrolase of the HAD superfamily